MKRHVLDHFLCAVALACLLAPQANATVLTIDGDVSLSNNASPPPAGGNSYQSWNNNSTIVSEYGDNVAGPTQSDVPSFDFGSPPWWYNFRYGNNGEGFTPNVTTGRQIIYSNVTNTATRAEAASGNLSKAAYPGSGSTLPGKWYWTFTADPGYSVKLISTDFDRFNAATGYSATVNVYSGDVPTSLGSLLYTSGSIPINNVATTISPNVSAQSLTLEFDIPASDGLFFWAADNIVFSQSAVPEPTSFALLSFAAIGMINLNPRRVRAAS